MKFKSWWCAALVVLSATISKAQTADQWSTPLHKRALPLNVSPSSTPLLSARPAAASTNGTSSGTTSSDPRDCQKLPITPDTWKQLGIDDMLRYLPDGQNMTISKYASLHGAGNFVCAIDENCNAGQLCHPVKAPAWQVLYAVQEYTNFMNAMVHSIDYSMAQLQAVSASMATDLAADISDSRFVVNLEWIFTDLYRGIAYGATTLFVVTLLARSPLTSLVLITDILFLTAIGVGIAAWIQGPPKTASFVPWTNLSFYLSQAQEELSKRITDASEEIFTAGITAENGLAKILENGYFFRPPSPAGLMETMEKSILHIVQARLLARLLRGQNAYVTISQSDCTDKGPGGARPGNDVLSYCDPKEKLLFNVVRAHKKKTINTIIGAAAITTKYGFSTEFIVRNSWQCQTKYGNFEHDPFADVHKVSAKDFMNDDCLLNLPVCDMRLDDIRNLKYSKHKTTTYACRKGGGLPI